MFTGRTDTSHRPALTYQRRATQSWVKISWSARSATGAAEWVPASRNSDAANEAGNGDQIEFGDMRVHVGGRSRVIHAFLVCF